MTSPRTAVDFSSASEPRWRLTAGATEAELVLGPAGLSLAALTDGRSGVSPRFVERHPMTVLSLAGERLGARQWRLRSWDAEEADRSILLRIGLEVTVAGGALALTEAVWLAADLPVLRRWVEVSNEGETSLTIERYHLLDLGLDRDPAVTPLDLLTVDAFAGHRWDRWEPGDANFAVHERRLRPGEAARFSVGAYQQGCSWLALAGDGVGAAVGLEYDGAAQFRVFDAARTAGAASWGTAVEAPTGVRLVADTADAINVRLEPGEAWRSPAAFVALFAGDWDDAAHVTHALVERHLAPPPPDDDFPYVIFNSWGYAWDIDPQRLLACLDLAAEIGVEVFVADYGWARDVGDWVPVGDRMPPLPDLAPLVRERGMKLGAWMGFANAAPTAPVLVEHPEWRAYPNDWGSFKSRALCLAEPAVRDWAAAEVVRVVGDHDLDYLVHDFEPITPCTHPAHRHPPDPAGYHSAAGYNEVLRRVRAAHPHLVIENCEGGGRVMTYAMVQLHDTSITSDGPVLRDALARRQALYGATYPFPLRYCDNYMEERPTDVACHSSMIGGPWILMDQLTAWSPAEVETARRNVALYKRIRPRFRDARVYHLRRPDGAAWDALQVHQPSTDRGVLFLFQPPAATSDQATPTLRGLDPTRLYRLSSQMIEETWTVSGADLAREGLVRSMEPGSSDVILVDPASDAAGVTRG
jgi:hypothetical protein